MLRSNEVKAKRKGRAYRCIRCAKTDSQVVDVKYRVSDHILKYHLSLDQVPFYCSLCLFRCSEEGQLLQHVTKYKRHQSLMVEKGIIDSSPYLVRNTNPYLIGDKDMEALSQEQSQSVFMQRVRPASSTTVVMPTQQPSESPFVVSTGLDESFDSMEAFVDSLVQPSRDQHATCPNVSPSTVQVPTEFLASLLKSQTSKQATPIQGLQLNTNSMPHQSKGQHLCRAPHALSTPATTKTPTAFPMGSSPINVSTMVQPNTAVVFHAMSSSGQQVNMVPSTPLLDERSEVEDILPQLLGNVTTSTPACTLSRSNATPTQCSLVDEPPKSTTTSTQCSLLDEPPAWINMAEKLMKRMTENIESNTRAIKGLEKTCMSVRDALDNVARLVRKLADDKSSSSTASSSSESNSGDRKRKHSNDDHQLKSVLGRVYPESKKHRY